MGNVGGTSRTSTGSQLTGGAALGGSVSFSQIGGNAPTESGGTTSLGGAGVNSSVPIGGATLIGAAGTTVQLPCPLYVGTGGTLVTPPTNGFEENSLEWGRTAAPTSASGVSRVTNDVSACEGTAYLLCDGDVRAASWDGPAINLVRFVQLGHKYAVTAAVRFDSKANVSGAGQTLGFTMGYWCDSQPTTGEGNEYINLHTMRASAASWSRLKGTFDFPPVACKDPNSVTKLQVYFETAYGVTEAAQASFHVDDFQLIDLTGAAGAPGNGGAAGAAGAAGAPPGAANAGTAGSGSVGTH
ncbi:MAG TPA: carbohydrate binding domain-containing protein [Polyangiaceae bacterium]|nr:carbohydrate binding domain-containing protein [Polyangiaceae bacterium]